MAAITIRNIRAILTAPAGINLVVVKVETSEPELYGLGCATFAYRTLAVASVVEDYLRPLLAGRDVSRVEELWHLMMNNAYWRNGPVINNAISGVDMALWDIKGKLARLALYDLWGGKCREAAAVYRHADGDSFAAIAESVRRFVAEGVRHVRVQSSGYGGSAMSGRAPEGALPGLYLDPPAYCRQTVRLFDYMRQNLDPDVELLHDVHERIPPIEAVRLAKDLEPYRLFFLEDLLSPEQGDYFRMIRRQAAVPLAQGELFNNPKEWEFLVAERLIDFIRVHVSQIGGLTPARKLAVFCEQFGVRTAWHGPGDVSPVGHAANIHLDLAASNFGIQEWAGISAPLEAVFPGCPQLRRGYVYLNDRPGLGIDLDEKLAARYPCSQDVTTWTQTRLVDGTLQRP